MLPQVEEIHLVVAYAGEAEPLTRLAEIAPMLSVHCVGIGALNAALGMQALVPMLQQQELGKAAVLFAGSVGCVSESEQTLLAAVTSSNVCFIDGSVAAGDAEFIGSEALRLEANCGLSEWIIGSEEEVLFEPIYCTPSITRSYKRAAALKQATGARFENLELFSIALVCYKNSIPWTSLCVSTNLVGERGKEQWNSNKTRAAEKTAQILERAIVRQTG